MESVVFKVLFRIDVFNAGYDLAEEMEDPHDHKSDDGSNEPDMER